MKLKNIMTLSFIKHLKSSNLLDMNQKLHNCVPTNSFLSTITTNEDKTEEMFRAHWLNVKLGFYIFVTDLYRSIYTFPS
jgi:hypothetical protein